MSSLAKCTQRRETIGSMDTHCSALLVSLSARILQKLGSKSSPSKRTGAQRRDQVYLKGMQASELGSLPDPRTELRAGRHTERHEASRPFYASALHTAFATH